jgi:hypothetical protein
MAALVRGLGIPARWPGLPGTASPRPVRGDHRHAHACPRSGSRAPLGRLRADPPDTTCRWRLRLQLDRRWTRDRRASRRPRRPHATGRGPAPTSAAAPTATACRRRAHTQAGPLGWWLALPAAAALLALPSRWRPPVVAGPGGPRTRTSRVAACRTTPPTSGTAGAANSPARRRAPVAGPQRVRVVPPSTLRWASTGRHRTDRSARPPRRGPGRRHPAAPLAQSRAPPSRLRRGRQADGSPSCRLGTSGPCRGVSAARTSRAGHAVHQPRTGDRYGGDQSSLGWVGSVPSNDGSRQFAYGTGFSPGCGGLQRSESA